jgi:NADH-quinone oxidoreductase subunit N
MRTEKGPVETIEDLAGLSQTQGSLAFAFAALLFALAGIPPLAGFMGKYYVFLAAVQAKLWPLAIIGVITSVVGAYYYVRIVKVMYVDAPKGQFLPMQWRTAAVVGLSTILILFAFLPFPLRIGSLGDWLVGAAAVASRSLF